MSLTLTLALMLTKADLGKMPAGWEAAQTGAGKGSVWKVVADDTAPSKSGLALAQTAAGPEGLFNMCVAKSRFGNNVALAVSLKAIKGESDQGGGVVWLYQDANNYYVTRFNPLEDNFRVYKVVGGKRTHLGKEITCTLDDKHKLAVTDGTIQKPGLVGLWTKADAQTNFDRFEAKEFKK